MLSWTRRGLRPALAAVLALAAAFAPALAQAPTTTVTTARTYYRMTVKLEYHGEPTTIEVVVACNVRVTDSRLTGRSFDASRLPDLYAVRQKDGKAILVQSPDACNGETTDDGRVPADFLPIVVVYQNADDMQFGVGYFSEDAYENPLSELKFKGATIAKATREEWEEWRKTAPRNALRPEMRPIPSNATPERPVFVARCFGVRRLSLPPKLREVVRAYWPSQQPQFWQPDAGAEEELLKNLRAEMPPGHGPFDDKPWTAFMLGDRGQTIGLPTRVGGGRLINDPNNIVREKFPAALFPLRDALGIPWIADNPRDQTPLFSEIELRRDALKGTLYCYAPAPVVSNRQELLDRYVPGFREREQRCRVDGVIVDGHRACRAPNLFFERDQFVFANHSVTMGDALGASE